MDRDRDATACASRPRDRDGIVVQPANVSQAATVACAQLMRRLPGPRRTPCERISSARVGLRARFTDGGRSAPHQWQVKHVRWYLEHGSTALTPSTRYRHWLTLRWLVIALDKE